MIIHSHKLIIITPPKTGSVSLIDSLIDLVDFKRINKQHADCFDYSDELGAMSKHSDLKLIKSKFGDKLDEYIIFASIRNPFDRIVSHWKWHCRFIKKDMSFEEFLEAELLNRNASYKWYAGKNMVDFISIDGEILVNNFIRFENLQEDFDSMCYKVGIEKRKLPHKNKSKGSGYKHHYNDRSKQIVCDIFSKDIDQFFYKFDG